MPNVFLPGFAALAGAGCAEPVEDRCTGYPIGNFGIAAEVTPAGRGLATLLYNPPVLGLWLQDLGCGRFVFNINGLTIADDAFADARVERVFPEASVELRDPRVPGISIRSRFLAPIRAADTFVSSIPAICADIEIRNDGGAPADVRTVFELEYEPVGSVVSLVNAGDFWLIGSDRVSIGFDGSVQTRKMENGTAVATRRLVRPGNSEKLRFILVCHHPDAFYADRCADLPSLACWLSENWRCLQGWRKELIDMLPRTHDEQVNSYLRWYLQAAVLLTRVTRREVLTLGYTELNQRDSYWTSWPHLCFWPDLERRMIEESTEFQRDDGKIPTTILPVIERGDDIDINEYFCLRIARYYDWTRDVEFLRKVWPNFKRSVEYLAGRDIDDDGMLEQDSYWADWKDVSGVEGRRAAPHFEFLWLAVLKYGLKLAQVLGDNAVAKSWDGLYERAYGKINSDVANGGLWNGSFYTTLWNDGTADAHVQEDQCVGPLFGVVPAERVPLIYRALDSAMTPWGIRDTWPYREDFSNEGGDYHNGGVWVFLNFVDAMSRFVTGYPEGAWEILRRVGEWDLERWGDYMPAEYLNGNTGQNAGKPIQGWDACFFAAILFGALGVRIMDANTLEIMPRIEVSQSFETPIITPFGVLRLKQVSGTMGADVTLVSALSRDVRIRYGALGARTEGNEIQTVGDCLFAVREFVLPRGSSHTLTFAL